MRIIPRLIGTDHEALPHESRITHRTLYDFMVVVNREYTQAEEKHTEEQAE